MVTEVVDTEYDLVVVGAGLMGSATAAAAARRGLAVLVLEQFEPGHREGSSHGSARIVRRAYGDELYTRLTGQAFELWRELELASGSNVLRLLGGLDFGPSRDVPAVAAHLADNGVPHEVLPAAEAQVRWPGMRFTGDVVFHAEAGVVDAEGAVTAFLELARRHGAEVRHATRVAQIEASEPMARVVVEAGGDEVTVVRCGHVVVAAGAWVEPLVDGLVTLPPLRVTQQQVFHFPRWDTSAPPWPSVIHEDVHPIYHLAGGRDGGPGDDRKIAEHDLGQPTTAVDRDGVVDPASRERITAYVREWLPGLDPTARSESTCLYTTTPTEDFILDAVGPVIVCSPCSGHGAKFAPLIGELAAGLAIGDADVPERFRLASHALGRVGKVSF
jgi:sarcosine oxidase